MIRKLRQYLVEQANQNNENSISNKLRKKRFEFFEDYSSKLKKPLHILDLGGSDYHWRNSNFANNKDYRITLVNIENQNLKGLNNISFIKLDVSGLGYFRDREFELVYSNSLIEHLPSFDDQKKLAEEIMRIGMHYFVQTPNFNFPIEPHFLFPFFQYLSDETKVKLLMKHQLGWYEKQSSRDEALKLARSINMLNKNKLMQIFPGGKIIPEKYFALTKSFIVYN